MSQPTGLHGLLDGSVTFLFVDDFRTSQETHGPSWLVTG
jgi:hypothetical protein